jgi:hypothetical protein
MDCTFPALQSFHDQQRSPNLAPAFEPCLYRSHESEDGQVPNDSPSFSGVRDWAVDEPTAKALWDLSEQLTGLKMKDDGHCP